MKKVYEFTKLRYIAPIASLMIEKYIKGEVMRPNIEKRVLTLNQTEE